MSLVKAFVLFSGGGGTSFGEIVLSSVTPEHSHALQEKLGPRLTLQTYQGDHVPPQEVIAESLSWAARKLSDPATPARSIGE